MNIIFPVPRITESFIDKIIELMGGRRLNEEEKAFEKDENADYLLKGSVAELKILEEEGLEKRERQIKIANSLSDKFYLPDEVDISIEHMPESAKDDYRRIIATPIRKRVRKAAKQIKKTKQHLGKQNELGLLIAVNNGFNSLPHDEFDNLVLSHCRRSTSQIDFILCTTIEYHQGVFDSYVFCSSNGYSVDESIANPFKEDYIRFVGDQFNERMTYMVRNQVELMAANKDLLVPVSDIVFDREGVRFIRQAPNVPDSRFFKENP